MNLKITRKIKNIISNNFKKILLFLILFILISILLLLIYNYYKGKIFRLYKNSSSNKIVYIDVKMLPEKLINEVENLMQKKGHILDPKSNFNNTQGKKLEYEQLPKDVVDFYINKNLKQQVSQAIGENVDFADLDEKCRIFSRLYSQNNDFIDWHYDNNFTIGNRYTLVIPIKVDLKNTSQFVIKDKSNGKEKIIPIELGKGVIYNGSDTYHKITKQTHGQERLVIIIPFYSNKTKSYSGFFQQKFRDIYERILTL